MSKLNIVNLSILRTVTTSPAVGNIRSDGEITLLACPNGDSDTISSSTSLWQNLSVECRSPSRTWQSHHQLLSDWVVGTFTLIIRKSYTNKSSNRVFLWLCFIIIWIFWISWHPRICCPSSTSMWIGWQYVFLLDWWLSDRFVLFLSAIYIYIYIYIYHWFCYFLIFFPKNVVSSKNKQKHRNYKEGPSYNPN